MSYNANVHYVHQDQGANAQIYFGAPFARPDHRHRLRQNSDDSRIFDMVLLWMGSFEIALGIICSILGIAMLLIANGVGSASDVTQVSPGIWCGAFLIFCGVFGVLGSKYPTAPFYCANIAMCVITAIFMGILVILSSIFAVIEARAGDNRTLEGLHICLAVFGFFGLIDVIVHSAFTCAGFCCIKRRVRRPTDIRIPTAQPVAYATQFIPPVTLPYRSIPEFNSISLSPPWPQHVILNPPEDNKQEVDAGLPPPPYRP